jgi:hypothetical protein
VPRPTKAIRPMENRTLEIELAWHACCLPDSTLAAERDFEEEKRRASPRHIVGGGTVCRAADARSSAVFVLRPYSSAQQLPLPR